jgi:hypothetical protein
MAASVMGARGLAFSPALVRPECPVERSLPVGLRHKDEFDDVLQIKVNGDS